jgi:hypothetical protein
MGSSRLRYPLLGLAIFTLLAGLWAGLVRLGWDWSPLRPGLPLAHGPLMVSGFLGTLIGLERAVALRERWTYLGPALSGLGGLVLITGIPGPWGPLFITLSSLAMVAVFAVILRRHPAFYTAVMAAGAVCWLTGNLLWFSGWPVFRLVLWWAGFLILTIAGERLELGRLIRLSTRVQLTFLGSAGLFLMGLVALLPAYSLGTRLAGAGMLALAAWLLRYDIARRTVRKPGLPRFSAICLLSGYVWLGLAGGIALVFGGVPAGPYYDALLHSIFLGFVFSMIFGHAPIIFPAVLNVPVVFSGSLYAPLILLHASLYVRVGADLLFSMDAVRWAGLVNGVALLLFIGNTAYIALSARREAGSRQVASEKIRLEASLGVDKSKSLS